MTRDQLRNESLQYTYFPIYRDVKNFLEKSYAKWSGEASPGPFSKKPTLSATT